jgi:hypothetical protein
MGTWISHLRIAEACAERIPELDQTAFVFGSLAPDSGLPNADWSAFDPPREVTHFTTAGGEDHNCRDLDFYREYVQTHPPEQDLAAYSFSLGYFVHLLSDHLWMDIIGLPSRQQFARLFTEQGENEAWTRLKGDWYRLDHLFLREHPDDPFWQTFLNAEIPTCPLPFLPQAAFAQQMHFIRTFYQNPEPRWFTEEKFLYLSQANLENFIQQASHCCIKILRAIRLCPPPAGIESALLLLPATDLAPLSFPLGD